MIFGFKFVQSALFALNSMYIGIGVVLISTGAYAKGASIVTSHSVIGGIIAVGVFLILVSLLGIYGTSKHHQVALFFYMIILSCVFVIQFCVTVACLGAVSRDGIASLVEKGWRRSSNETIWDAENNFQCCGLKNATDHAVRCDELLCARTSCDPCLELITERMCDNLQLLGGIGLFFSFTELIGVWLAIRYRNLKDPLVDPVLYFQQQH